MESSLARQAYNPGERPTHHNIGKRSVEANPSLNYCKEHGLRLHATRMHPELAKFHPVSDRGRQLHRGRKRRPS
jgi:hypothetical protein